MLRVLGTIKNSPYSKHFGNEQGDLEDWIGDIHNGMKGNLPSSGISYNYANDSSTGSDAASTALFAATVYRAVTLYEPVPGPFRRHQFSETLATKNRGVT
ncbi:hypothetical protein FRC04_006225 [Tulasnella sp. 424]|nr:hypothetical protein FRC04_006225 [Tulasnella sp. 424]